jgi:hypothetical protein
MGASSTLLYAIVRWWQKEHPNTSSMMHYKTLLKVRELWLQWNNRMNNVQPSLIRADSTMHTVLGYFTHFLPFVYFKTTVLPTKNAHLSDPLLWEEFLCFLGLIYLMAMSQGSKCET